MSRLRASTRSAATSLCKGVWAKVIRRRGIARKNSGVYQSGACRPLFHPRAGGLDEGLVRGELALDECGEALGRHRHRLGVKIAEASADVGRGERVDERLVEPRRRLRGQMRRRKDAE